MDPLTVIVGGVTLVIGIGIKVAWEKLFSGNGNGRMKVEEKIATQVKSHSKVCQEIFRDIREGLDRSDRRFEDLEEKIDNNHAEILTKFTIVQDKFQMQGERIAKLEALNG